MRRNKLPHFYGFGYTPTLNQDGGGGGSAGGFLMPGSWSTPQTTLPPAPTGANTRPTIVMLPPATMGTSTKIGPILSPPPPPIQLEPPPSTTTIPPTTTPPMIRCPAPYDHVFTTDATQCPQPPPSPIQFEPPPQPQPMPPTPVATQGQGGTTPGTVVTVAPPPLPAGYWAQFQALAMAQKLLIAAGVIAGIGIGATIVAHRRA